MDGQHQSAVAPQELQPAPVERGIKGETSALCVDASPVTGASYFWSWRQRKRVWIWSGSSWVVVFCFFLAGSQNHPESVIRI